MVPDEEDKVPDEEEDVFEVARKLAKAEVAKELKKKEKEITARVEGELKQRYEKAISELKAKTEKRETELQEEMKKIEQELEKRMKEHEKVVSHLESQLNESRAREGALRQETEALKAEYARFREKAESDLASKEAEVREVKAQAAKERERIESSFLKREEMLQAEVAEARRRLSEMQKEVEERIARREAELKEVIEVEREKAKAEFQANLAKEEQRIRDEITERLNREYTRREAELRKEMEDAIRRKEIEMRGVFDAERTALEKEREKRIESEVKKAEETVRAKLEVEFKTREEKIRQEFLREMEAKRKEFENELRTRIEKEKEALRAILEVEYRKREDLIRQQFEREIARREDEIRKARSGAGDSGHPSLLLRRGVPYSEEPFPFSGIVGQDRAKRALILNAINPAIGGILLWGEEGNGKTMMVVSFAYLLNDLKRPDGKPILPWNSEERFISGVFPSRETISYGMIDTELNMGVLSRAMKGKDPNEVRFVLDMMSRGHFEILEAFRRMAMHIRVDPLSDPSMRMEVAKRLREYMVDPRKVRKEFEHEDKQLKERILKARDSLAKINLSTKIQGKISQICHLKELPMKMDFLLSELARTNAAFEGRESVAIEDVQDAADLILAYRTDEKLMRMLKSD